MARLEHEVCRREALLFERSCCVNLCRAATRVPGSVRARAVRRARAERQEAGASSASSRPTGPHGTSCVARKGYSRVAGGAAIGASEADKQAAQVMDEPGATRLPLQG